ncbi:MULTISPECIES: hypothetical protein [unclassified Fibrobacter]|uniref:hypothetical protein n=1 Tax=unclassified Fibrobacter TaxID=2634177 RepID=UPI000D6D98DC|nr:MULTISPECIES: hypothetical protein [unclassified Fibrobacter]PWJ68535.1 hypothetical protein BGX12_10761 [Fibrobacter sp. UWR4]PZW72073.1 hypothetical protein C8E88_100845 [Fibrobacter sp. UWR1]
MAVDEATKKQDQLELYQIDDSAILPFFESHVEEFRKFIQEREALGLSLLEHLKQFIRSVKQPFNMRRYMDVQSTYIRQTLQHRNEDRQQAVSHWIQENAGKHRNRMIQLQCLYLDRIKDRLLPEIEALLNSKKDQ